MWDKECLVVALADLTVDCIGECKEFSGHNSVVMMPFITLCTCDGFGQRDKQIPHLSQGLWNRSLPVRNDLQPHYVYCLRLLVIGNLFRYISSVHH